MNSGHKIFRVLRLFCPLSMVEEIEGDLVQRYERDVILAGESVAKRRLTWNTIRYFRPEIIFRNRFTTTTRSNYMIRSYIKIAFRNFAKQKGFTALNLIGLALGMASCVFILNYVKFEKSFDRFHSKAEDIYRIQYDAYRGKVLNYQSAVAVPAIAHALKDNFPEVIAYTRFLPINGVMSYDSPAHGRIAFNETKMQYADTSVFAVFDFKLINGNPKTCLSGLHKVILSESAAKKYFHNEDPIGKKIARNGRTTFEVTGVFKDVPENSHIRFDFLFSYQTLNAQTKNSSETRWGWYDFYTFVLLKPNTDVNALQAKLDDWLEKNRGAEWAKEDLRQAFILRPLVDIHLYSNLLYEAQPDEQRDGDTIHALSIIALFILVIAWVNYINLATAKAMNRANEVGVRKVMGAFREQLIGQFFMESFLLNLMATGIALLIVAIGWSRFTALTGWHIPNEFWFDRNFWFLLGGLFVLGVVLSGFYPAVVLSSFKPAAILKGKMVNSGGGQIFRKGLVVFQFTASIFLISGSVVIFQQLQFMKQRNLGVDIRQTMVVKGPSVTDSLYVSKLEAFRSEVMRIPGVKNMTTSSNVPGDEIFWTMGMERLSGGSKASLTVSTVAIDFDYVQSFGLLILEGRNFDIKRPADDKKVIINKALAEGLNFKDPQSALGETVNYGGDTLEIIGVLDNYHQMSMKSPVAPIGFVLQRDSKFYAMKLETNNFHEVLQKLEQPWKAYFPGNPIDYFFLDEFFNRQYDKDDRFGNVANLFAGLAIFIATLGLVGLASYTTVQRTKEIGIRKVLGASVSGIVLLLSRGFVQLVLIANLIAWPLAWWIMDQWLQTFPFHIQASPLTFILAGLGVGLIAFLAVGSQTFRAAMTKPAETLKYE